MIKNFTLISITIVAFAVASFFGISLFSSSKIQAQEINQQESMRICCAWGDKLADGVLTYKIVGDSINTDNAEAEQAVYNAINVWNSRLHGISKGRSRPITSFPAGSTESGCNMRAGQTF